MKKNLKKILVGLVVVIVLAVIFLRGDQLEELVTTIERGAPLFLIGAGVVLGAIGSLIPLARFLKV